MIDTTTPRRSRLRRWLMRLFAVIGVLVLAVTGTVTWLYVKAGQSNVGELSFRNPLLIPPVLEPTIDEHGRKRFELTMRQSISELLPGTSTPTWGVNGSYLGPTLRATGGDKVAIDVANELPERSTLHWHGMRLPAEMDGGPHRLIEPGETWSPYWTVDQPAASLWYHPHLHGKTAEHVYRGVSGMFLIEHEDAGMMGQFVIVEPGTEDEVPAPCLLPGTSIDVRPAGRRGARGSSVLRCSRSSSPLAGRPAVPR